MSVPYSGMATVGADGTAQIVIGPQRAGEKWKVLTMTVTNDSTIGAPQCRVYRSFVSATAVLDVTGTGAFDTSTLAQPLALGSGENLVAYWFDADVGSTCVLTVDVESTR